MKVKKQCKVEVTATKSERKAAAKKLDAMLELLGPKGEHWITGNEEDDEGNFCLLGALKHTAGPRELVGKVLTLFIKEKYKRSGSIADFNDADKTVFGDIKKVINGAKTAIASGKLDFVYEKDDDEDSDEY